MEEILSAVSTVGFPIACCVALFIYMDREGARHREETKELKEVISANTIALVELKQIIQDRGV